MAKSEKNSQMKWPAEAAAKRVQKSQSRTLRSESAKPQEPPGAAIPAGAPPADAEDAPGSRHAAGTGPPLSENTPGPV